jgi:probable biosynthetic protein (TIGR04098 family)
MTQAPWAENQFFVEMPHMVPGEKLSEVEFLKMLAAYQWRGIADRLGTPPQNIANDAGERLYGSVIDFEMNFGAHHSLDRLCEGAPVHVRNRVDFYAGRFVEGFFVFGDEEIPADALPTLKTKRDLRDLGLPWAYMTNAFIARTGSNTRLKVFQPAGIDESPIEQLKETPGGIVDHRAVQASGEIPDFGDQYRPRPLESVNRDPIVYQIVPESDLNGAGLVYFARYLAMMNYGERLLLNEHLGFRFSSDLVSCLSTDHRRVFFYGNASPSDSVEIQVRASVMAPGDFPAAEGPARWRTPLKFEFSHELYRGTDKTLMAISRVRKSLNVPGDRKGVLMEAERFLRRLG